MSASCWIIATASASLGRPNHIGTVASTLGSSTFLSFLSSANANRFLFAIQKLDRKSTRLNSSHANISYAVFCLKKKTLELLYEGIARAVLVHLRRRAQLALLVLDLLGHALALREHALVAARGHGFLDALVRLGA